MRRHISQREAHKLAKRVQELEARNEANRRTWSKDYVGGVMLGSFERPADWLNGQIHCARKLGYAVVVTTDSEQKKLCFYAVKP